MGRLLLLAGVALSAGCGSTVIRSTDPAARIYLDGELVGIGEAEVDRMGGPADLDLRVEEHGVVTHRTLEREFTAATLALGMLTVYTGFFWAWQLPAEVTLPAPAAAAGYNPWGPAPGAADPWGPPPVTAP